MNRTRRLRCDREPRSRETGGGGSERAMRVERAGAGAFVLAEGKRGIPENETEKRDGCVNIYRGRIVG